MSLSDGIAWMQSYGEQEANDRIVKKYGTQDVAVVLTRLGRISIADTGQFVATKVVQSIDLKNLNKDYRYNHILYTNSRPGNTPEIDTWIDYLHAVYHIPYTVDGAKRVFLKMAEQVLSAIGLNALSASLLSAAWAVHYGQWLYLDRYGYFPTDPAKFIQEALDADDVEGII